MYAIGDWGQNADIQSLAVATSGITDASATAYSYNPATLYTTDAVTTDVFETFPQITNRSGLMESQALNILFGHVDYTWSDCCWMPTLGLIGSVGFTGSSSVTANYWDAGARFGFSY